MQRASSMGGGFHAFPLVLAALSRVSDVSFLPTCSPRGATDRKRKRLIETWGTAPDPAPGGGEEEEGRKIKRERKTKKIE